MNHFPAARNGKYAIDFFKLTMQFDHPRFFPSKYIINGGKKS